MTSSMMMMNNNNNVGSNSVHKQASTSISNYNSMTMDSSPPPSSISTTSNYNGNNHNHNNNNNHMSHSFHSNNGIFPPPFGSNFNTVPNNGGYRGGETFVNNLQKPIRDIRHQHIDNFMHSINNNGGVGGGNQPFNMNNNIVPFGPYNTNNNANIENTKFNGFSNLMSPSGVNKQHTNHLMDSSPFDHNHFGSASNTFSSNPIPFNNNVQNNNNNNINNNNNNNNNKNQPGNFHNSGPGNFVGQGFSSSGSYGGNPTAMMGPFGPAAFPGAAFIPPQVNKFLTNLNHAAAAAASNNHGPYAFTFGPGFANGFVGANNNGGNSGGGGGGGGYQNENGKFSGGFASGYGGSGGFGSTSTSFGPNGFGSGFGTNTGNNAVPSSGKVGPLSWKVC